MSAVLELDGVCSGYGATQVLRGVSFDVEAGTVVALLGRNGMGKSTTISTIAGLVSSTAGRVSLNGTDISRENAVKRARRGIGLVPDARRVFASCTVREHLTMGARRRAGASAPWNLERIYEVFPVLRHRSRAMGNELSGGEQQMLAIARALSANPDLLLLDEPSEGLAPSVVYEIADVLRGLAKQNTDGAIVIVEQNVALALSVADRVLLMSQGQVVYDGSVSDFAADADLQARYIGVG